MKFLSIVLDIQVLIIIPWDLCWLDGCLLARLLACKKEEEEENMLRSKN
jgi:hypothetical protein